jgi:integrase
MLLIETPRKAALVSTLEILEPEEDEPETSKSTFSDAVRHFRKTHLRTLKPSTRATYEDRLTRLLVPRFGSVALADITGDMLAALDVDLVKDELSSSSRRNAHIVFRSVLRVAVDAGLLDAMPKLPKLPKVGRRIPHSMHREDLEAILAKSSPRARLAFSLAAFAGLRRGEVTGLRWSDVDLKGGVITVRRAVTRGEETTPKSGNHRAVPIAAPLRALVEEATATKKSPWAPVTVTIKGKAWAEDGLNQAFQRAQARAGRIGFSFHSLRHFFITELFRNRVPAPAVQRLAGHAELTTTQLYADMVASDLKAAIATFSVAGGVKAEGV